MRNIWKCNIGLKRFHFRWLERLSLSPAPELFGELRWPVHPNLDSYLLPCLFFFFVFLFFFQVFSLHPNLVKCQVVWILHTGLP